MLEVLSNSNKSIEVTLNYIINYNIYSVGNWDQEVIYISSNYLCMEIPTWKNI